MSFIDKLKEIEINQSCRCSLKVGTLHEDSIFRYMQEYSATIEKKKDATSLAFLVPDQKLKFILYLRNFNLIYQTSTLVYYIVSNGAPAMYREVKEAADMKWFQVDLHEISRSKDEVFNYAFPYILVFKVEFEEYFDDFDMYIEKTKCRVETKEICDINWADFDIPDYTEIFSFISSWEVKYMLLVLITYNYMTLDQVTPETLQNIEYAENAERVLEEFYNNYESFSLEKFNEYLYEGILEFPRQPNENRVVVRKIRFTPSGLIFDPSEEDVSNRVVRKFKDIDPKFYLRISIEDENGEKRLWRQCDSILLKFKKNLKKITVLGRDFEFLGFSNSQMKNHSCWMVSPESGYTAEEIRSHLGDFTNCKNNSKYASRLGLCFSGTSRTINLRIEQIPDVERNGFVFTDGIGKISFGAMERVKDELGISRDQIVCAVQVRIGGCKGVLALSGDCEEIQVRPSMIKFHSYDNDLEVCSYSAYRLGFLNRQIILLLEGRGIDKKVFINLQKKMTDELDSALVDENSALKMINGQDYDPSSKILRNMLENNIKIKEEPFLQRMLTANYQVKLEDIKNKARILAPDSLILIGVVDEFAVLEYGQCFFYPSVNAELPIKGRCTIAKNPCLHPGDIRVLTAVDVPELRFLRDVLVFPQKGKRPHPNECSGSDLDGDMYFVTWNPALIPLIDREDPMDYTPHPEKTENPSIEGVIEFYLNYMKSENLGNIANTHLAQADRHGIRSPQVLKLAELHSMAVDYPKTGVEAIIPRDYRVVEWPDFMEKEDSKSYKSEKALGYLYRSVADKKVENHIPLSDSRYLHEGYRLYVNEAKDLYKKYSTILKRLIRQFDTVNEYNFFALNPGERVGKRGRYDSKQKMVESMTELFDEIRKDFYSRAERDQDLTKLASACYWVSYSREKRGSKVVSKFLSFPWIFSEHLIRID